MIKALSVAVLLVTSGPALGNDVVRRHIAAVGGSQALAALKSMERSARATVMTPNGTFDGHYREIYDLQKDRGATTLRSDYFEVRSGWSAGQGWRDHSLEGASEMDAATLGLARMQSTPSVIASVVQQYGESAVGPSEACTYAGEPCDLVTFAGSPLELLVSRENHMILSAVVPGILSYHYREFEDVDGFLLPHEVTLQIPAEGLTLVYRYRKTSFDGRMKDSHFRRRR